MADEDCRQKTLNNATRKTEIFPVVTPAPLPWQFLLGISINLYLVALCNPVIDYHLWISGSFSPRVLNPSPPRDLETICLKCLNKERHERYGTAQLLAEELQRFLEGLPVLARPISRPVRAWQWYRRNSAVCWISSAASD